MTAWVPKPYQLDGVKFLLQHANAGVFLDPGMGKTSITLTTVAQLFKTGHVKRVLVVAPIRPMYMVWPKEIQKWDHTSHLRYAILHGKDKESAVHDIAHVYLINPEGLKWLVASGGLDKINPDVLVIDESTKFKDSQTSRFKLLKPYLRQFKRRIILTGEPAPNGYMDLFGQMYIVDMGNALGRFITHYRANYFYPSGYGGYDFKLQHGAKERIQDRIRPCVMRLAAEDHLDMPELIFNDILVGLDAKSMETYKQFEDGFFAVIQDTAVMAPNGAAAGSKCRQVANGGVYDEGHLALHVHDVKTDALRDLVEQLQDQPLLVFYEFQHDLDRIKKAYPNAPCLTGLTGAKLDAVISSFNKGDIPILLAHPLSGGHGLNLQESCHHVCYYGLGWDLDTYHQSYKRVWRQGQPSNRVFVHRIIAKDTLDEYVAKVLAKKEVVQNELNEALKGYRNEQRPS